MGIGVAFFCKINGEHRKFATTSNIDEELKKRTTPCTMARTR